MKAFLEKMEVRICLIPERPKKLRGLWNRFPCSEMVDLYCYYFYLRPHNADMVVVSNGTPGQFLGLAAVPGRFLYIAHTYPQPGAVVRWSRRLKQCWFRSLFSSSMKRIVSVSRFSAKRITEVWFAGKVRPGAVTVIYNAGGCDLQTPCRVDADRRSNSVVVLTLGHVAEHKNPAGWFRVAKRVIHAAAKIGLDCSFVWAGETVPKAAKFFGTFRD